MPDFKVWNASTSKRLLKADNYAEVAMESIKRMHKQVGDLCFTSDGIAKKGLLLRHLVRDAVATLLRRFEADVRQVMPGYEDEGKQIVKWLAENISKDLYVRQRFHSRSMMYQMPG